MARSCAALVIGLWCGLSAPAQGDPLDLRLGLMPFAPDTELVHRYGALEEHLTAELDLRVTLAGAPDYAAFTRRALAGEYELVLTAPHLALLMMRKARWQPLVRVNRATHPIVVVLRRGALRTLADLRRQRLATPDRLALVTLIVERELARREQLVAGRDFTIRYARSHENAMLLVERGLAEAGVATSSLLKTMPGPLRARLRVLHEYPRPIALVYMASPRLSGRLREAIRDELLRMPTKLAIPFAPPEPGTPGHVPLDEAELSRYVAFLPMLETRLQQASAP